MSTSKRLAELLLLTTALTLPGVALAQSTDEPSDTSTQGVASSDPDEDAAGVDDAPAEEEYDEPDISIPGGGSIVVTGRRTRDVTRSSSQVVSVLTDEQIARTGEGDIAGALSRVTGLSVVGDGFVYVRGLGDRYSLALLNGLPLPSPEPLRRVVPLDIFPTNIVASSLVQKTYSANFPGEFGGGVINLTTQAVPDEPFLKISAGISGDSETTGRDGLSYYGGDIDWLGFDDGTRDLPPALTEFLNSGARLDDASVDQQAIGKQLIDPNLVVMQNIGNLPPNFSGTITGGTSFDIGSDARLGVIATASLSNSWRNRSIIAQTSNDIDVARLDTDGRVSQTDNRVVFNALFGLGLEFGKHKARWTNVYIRDTLKQGQLSYVEDSNNGFTKLTQDNGWFERQLIDSQLVFELQFGQLDVDLRGGYARTDREAPYEYEFQYVRTNNPGSVLGDKFVNVLDQERGFAKVAFSDLKEELWYGGIDLSYPLTPSLRATAGYAYTDTDRYSERREFLYNPPSTRFRPPGSTGPISNYDGIGMLSPNNLLGGGLIDFYNIGLIDLSQAVPAVSAGLRIHAGYGMLRYTGIDALTVELGVRYEDAQQFVTPVEVFAVPTVNVEASTALANDYFLPAATITYEVTPDLQLRLSGSKTVARPQFRELIFQPYEDPDSNQVFEGNPFLRDSELTNAEARVEYYFGNGSRVSAAGFYKDIKNPIEAYSRFGDNARITSFANAPKAELYGGELELQYNHDLHGLGGWFETKRAMLVANYTYTQSEIKVGDGKTYIFPSGERPAANVFNEGVPLTGQSDHLVNLQFGLEDTERLQQFTFLLSYASKRVTSRGTNGQPDIIEDPGLRLDFVYRNEVEFMGLPVELKFEARNITGRGHEEYQASADNRIEINTYDIGRSLSASAAVRF